MSVASALQTSGARGAAHLLVGQAAFARRERRGAAGVAR